MFRQLKLTANINSHAEERSICKRWNASCPFPQAKKATVGEQMQ